MLRKSHHASVGEGTLDVRPSLVRYSVWNGGCDTGFTGPPMAGPRMGSVSYGTRVGCGCGGSGTDRGAETES